MIQRDAVEGHCGVPDQRVGIMGSGYSQFESSVHLCHAPAFLFSRVIFDGKRIVLLKELRIGGFHSLLVGGPLIPEKVVYAIQGHA